MKIFKYLSMLLLITLALAACKDHEYDVYGGGSDNFRFPSTNRSATIAENSDSPAAIPIVFSKLTPRAGTVSFSFSGAVQNTDFVASASELTFSENQYQDTLYIQPLDNEEENEDLELVISLNSTDLIGWAGDSTSQDYVLTIKDDDAAGCDPTDLDGTYSCLSNGATGDGNGGPNQDLVDFPGTVTFTATGNPNEFALSDPSFGLYPDGYGIALPGVGNVTEDCGNLTLEAGYADQYSDPWTFSGTTDASQNMTIMWSNTYGDSFTVSLSPL